MMRKRKSVVLARQLVGKTAARELVPTMPGTSARWHMHDYPGPYCRWHYHPEFEIHLIQHGTGRSIVGNPTSAASRPDTSSWSVRTCRTTGSATSATASASPTGMSSSNSIRSGFVIASNYCPSCERSTPFLPVPPAASSSPDQPPWLPPHS